MRKIIIRGVQFLLVLVILYSSYRIFGYYKTNKEHNEKQEEIMSFSKEWEEKIEEESGLQSGKPSLPNENEKAKSKIEHLQGKYPNIMGWIKIPGTNIDYPLVKGEDNEYYLNHDYKGEYNVFGAVFMEKDNSPDFSDQNTIIYGHNIRTGKFFHELTTKYRNKEFAKENSTIEISHLGGKDFYEIFAVYSADPMEKFRTPNYSQEELVNLIYRINSKNEIEGIVPEDFEEILTLQTCLNNDKRLVIHAKKINEN